MTANAEQFLDKIARLDDTTHYRFTGSSKVYVQGSRSDLLVPMREIVLTDTLTESGHEPNAPVRVYDTSGVYSDPAVRIDLRAGLPPIRAGWIAELGDTDADTPKLHFEIRRFGKPTDPIKFLPAR